MNINDKILDYTIFKSADMFSLPNAIPMLGKLISLKLYKKLKEMMPDVIVLLASYSNENTDLIGVDEVKKMKVGCFFINTSRGEMVNENALIFGQKITVLVSYVVCFIVTTMLIL
jgi:hypothetical protein